MGFDYALVHAKYTIPPAIALTLLYRPLLTRLDIYKITFLIAIAVVSTTPWDSYLIRNCIWTYPSNVIIGPTLFRIPAEELFFFVIQTYSTSLLYLLLSKPTFHPKYLKNEAHGDGQTARHRIYKIGGQLVLTASIVLAVLGVRSGGKSMYLGLIVAWAFPFLLLLWSLAHQFLLKLPLLNTLAPILILTIYLWIVDTLALKRGTWVIESGTKLGYHLWDGLEIEEAIFFLVTNTLIVFGLVAFDNALAILDTFPDMFPDVPALPSPVLLVMALLTPSSFYNDDRIAGLAEAVARLRRKSRSFFIASSAFQGRLRIDLIILYSFCRVADDLIDDASSLEEAQKWLAKLRRFLDLSYAPSMEEAEPVEHFVTRTFPPESQHALLQLPTADLSEVPLYELLKGFEMDLTFSETDAFGMPAKYPINTETDLDLYGSRVAGTVAELCLELVFHHYPGEISMEAKERVIRAGGRMGIALQYVNISRDIVVDAGMKRAYIPWTWLDQQDLNPAAVIKNPYGNRIEYLRKQLLGRAFSIYEEARGAIEELPVEARAPMRVAVESYMEIGRVLSEGNFRFRAGRATVPKRRRIVVAWRALKGPRIS